MISYFSQGKMEASRTPSIRVLLWRVLVPFLIASAVGYGFWLAGPLVIAASSGTPQTPQSRESRTANLILITVDTLRADHLACYGYHGVATPAIDKLAADGVLFTDAIAQVPLTLPSHCSILTGDYPNYTGVHDNAGFFLKPQQPTLATILKAKGYQTAAFVGSSILDGRTGLARGFDQYSDLENAKLPSRRGDQVMQEALAWVQAHKNAKFFVWIHLFDCHWPYAAPEPYRSRYIRRPYDGEIAFVDALIGEMTRTLENEKLYDSTLIVFMSDHGEGLGQHGEQAHGLFVYNSTLHIPLIIKAAHAQWKHSRVRSLVRSVDVTPTILQLLSIPQRSQMQGHGLLSMMEGKDNQGESVAYSETLYPYYHFRWSPLFSVETNRYHYIQAPHPELYDLQIDPAEKKNIISQDRSMASYMESLLKGYQKFAPRTDKQQMAQPEKTVDSETVARLRSLGYVALSAQGSGTVNLGDLPDPKDKIGVYSLLQNAIEEAEQGRLQSSTRMLKRVLQEDSGLVDAYANLGVNYAQLQNYDEAIRAFKQAIKFDDHNVFAIYNLALCYASLGRFNDAIAGLQQALALDPNDTLSRLALAQVYQTQRNPDAAIKILEVAVSRDPGSREAHLALSKAYAQKGMNSQAETERRKAEKLVR